MKDLNKITSAIKLWSADRKGKLVDGTFVKEE